MSFTTTAIRWPERLLSMWLSRVVCGGEGGWWMRRGGGRGCKYMRDVCVCVCGVEVWWLDSGFTLPDPRKPESTVTGSGPGNGPASSALAPVGWSPASRTRFVASMTADKAPSATNAGAGGLATASAVGTTPDASICSTFASRSASRAAISDGGGDAWEGCTGVVADLSAGVTATLGSAAATEFCATGGRAGSVGEPSHSWPKTPPHLRGRRPAAAAASRAHAIVRNVETDCGS